MPKRRRIEITHNLTMADVARAAGVSAMTVSRALRTEGPVSPATRRRVLDAIDRLGYVPDMAAGALSSRRSRLVVVLVPSLYHPKYVEASRTITATLAARDLQVFLAETDNSPQREEQLLASILRRRPEAVVLPGETHTRRTLQLLRQAGVPVIEIGTRPEEPIEHFVGSSMKAAARALIAHLRAQGRKRIGFADGLDMATGLPVPLAQGYAEIMQKEGLGEPIIVSGGLSTSAYERGTRGLARLLDRHPDVDAVMFPCDRGAVGGLIEARRRGLSMPGQLALTGFGDFDVGRTIVPTITTAGINASGLGAEVAKMILTALEAGARRTALAALDRTLETHVIVREST